MAPAWRKKRTPEREREKESERERGRRGRKKSIKPRAKFQISRLAFHLRFCHAPRPRERQKSWQTFISATCLDMFYMCCTLHSSLPSGINHKYTHISFEIICGILAIIHSPRILLLSPHPCALSPPHPLLVPLLLLFFRKLSFSFFAA